MSIIIKGMKMPKEPFTGMWLLIDSNGCVYVDGNYQSNVEAVELPPHGRLIDGDIAEVITFSAEEGKGDFYDGILFAADFISNMPTIIEAEADE